jgi:hypothetical protein
MQIWWIVLFAFGFWAAIWQHEEVAKLSKTAFNAVLAVTSNLRGAPPPQASPAGDSSSAKSKRPASQPAPKGQE